MPGKRKNKQQTMVLSKQLTILTDKYNKVNKVTGDVVRSDFLELIEIPTGMAKSDWLIINAIEFLERTELLFSSCSLFCTVNTCPMFNAGPHYHYLWEDADTPQPVQLSAPEYFNTLKHWIRRNLNDEKLFPKASGVELSADAIAILKTTYRRLFRIMAHMYMCHFSHIQKQNMEKVINTVCAHYSTFALQYEMVEMGELEMLEPVYEAIARQSMLPPEEPPATPEAE
jgi:MOB kinase activator 1